MREACVCDHNGGRTFSRHSPALARVAQAAPARLPLRVAQTLKRTCTRLALQDCRTPTLRACGGGRLPERG